MQRPVLRSPALALDAGKLGGGRYAEFLKLLLDTRRYKKGENDFQLMADVNLEDGEPPVRVHVEFLAPSEVKLQKNRPKLIEGFRVLKFPACAVAFENPEDVEIEGSMISGKGEQGARPRGVALGLHRHEGARTGGPGQTERCLRPLLLP